MTSIKMYLEANLMYEYKIEKSKVDEAESVMNELLGYIENPRYVLIMKNNYEYSFACLTLIGQKKENVELYIYYLKRNQRLLLIHTLEVKKEEKFS